jgi:hypothetical protein
VIEFTRAKRPDPLFQNQMRLLKNSPEIMELPWNGYCGRPFGSFCFFRFRFCATLLLPLMSSRAV